MKKTDNLGAARLYIIVFSQGQTRKDTDHPDSSFLEGTHCKHLRRTAFHYPCLHLGLNKAHIHLQVGEMSCSFVVCLFACFFDGFGFVFVLCVLLSFKIKSNNNHHHHHQPLFLPYLWCKNAVRLNVHLEGFSWSSWVREFVMGTNDGSRNFSANCDLKRSMSSDRRWPQPREPTEQWRLQHQPEGAAGTRAGPPHRPSPLAPSLLLHTPGRKEEKGKLFLIVQPSGCRGDHEKDGGHADSQGRSPVQGCCPRRGGDFESAPRTAASSGPDPATGARPENWFLEKGQRKFETPPEKGVGVGWGVPALTFSFPSPSLIALSALSWRPQEAACSPALLSVQAWHLQVPHPRPSLAHRVQLVVATRPHREAVWGELLAGTGRGGAPEELCRSWLRPAVTSTRRGWAALSIRLASRRGRGIAEIQERRRRVAAGEGSRKKALGASRE